MKNAFKWSTAEEAAKWEEGCAVILRRRPNHPDIVPSKYVYQVCPWFRPYWLWVGHYGRCDAGTEFLKLQARPNTKSARAELKRSTKYFRYPPTKSR